MKIIYLNLNIPNIRCDSRDNKKQQCSCISTATHSKIDWLEGWLKRSENNMKDIIGISVDHWRVHLRWGSWNNTRKIRFSVKVDFQLYFFQGQEIFNAKTSSKELLDRGKDPFHLSNIYTSSNSTVGLLLHRQR